MSPIQSTRPIQSIQWLVAWVTWLLTGATARWLGEMPDIRQRVYFANHTSHLDFVVLWAALPAAVRSRTRPVAGADYWAKGWLKRFLAQRVFRAVLISRRSSAEGTTHEDIVASARAAIETTVRALADGSSLILFPEGTRGPGGEPGPFKPGLFHLCQEYPGLELVPVWLDQLGRVLPKGEILPVPLLATATLGLPMRLEDGEDRDAFLDRARQALIGLWPDRPRGLATAVAQPIQPS